MQPIFNILIAPMFNKFTPMPEGPLLDKIKNYLQKVNFPVKKLEVMDGSKDLPTQMHILVDLERIKE